MPFITIKNQTLHYQIHGTGFPVLLGHSYLWDSSMWAPQIEALSEHYLRPSLTAFTAEQLRQSIVPLGRVIFGRPDTSARLADLDSASTLLMCGALDTARPPEETLRMAEIIGCNHVLIPDAGHISNLENPSFVTETLLDWLGQHTTV